MELTVTFLSRAAADTEIGLHAVYNSCFNPPPHSLLRGKRRSHKEEKRRVSLSLVLPSLPPSPRPPTMGSAAPLLSAVSAMLVAFLFVSVVDGFYLPGVAPQDFMKVSEEWQTQSVILFLLASPLDPSSFSTLNLWSGSEFTADLFGSQLNRNYWAHFCTGSLDLLFAMWFLVSWLDSLSLRFWWVFICGFLLDLGVDGFIGTGLECTLVMH